MRDFIAFLRVRKKWWLLPFVVVILLGAGFVAFVISSGVPIVLYPLL